MRNKDFCILMLEQEKQKGCDAGCCTGVCLVFEG